MNRQALTLLLDLSSRERYKKQLEPAMDSQPNLFKAKIDYNLPDRGVQRQYSFTNAHRESINFNSTLLFLALPSAVRFSARGFSCPNPVARSRD